MRYECVRCGACCRWDGYVRVSAGEIDRMSAHLGMSPRAFAGSLCRLTDDRAGLSLVEKDDGSCVMLTAGNACAVHDVKPAQCRGFPDAWRFDGFERLCRARPLPPEGDTQP